MWTAYLERYRNGEWRDRIFHDMIVADARARSGGPTILDIGCGRGFDGNVPLQETMARLSSAYIGVEPDPTVTPGSCFSEVHRCRFEDAPIPPASVDVAYAIMVLEHLAAPQTFWDKVWEVLREGGVFWALTVDARHWFCRASWWSERLRIKDLYLDAVLGRRGTERYENYPVHYRCNTPRQVRAYTDRFRSCDFINFARVGQLNTVLVRPLHRLASYFDRRAIRKGKPGTLLFVRAVK